MKEHILDAALELMKDEGFENFTARRIAEYLNASTQPIYNEFQSMDQLKDHLLDYVKEIVHEEIFKGPSDEAKLVDVCANYIRFAKNEATLFNALFMGRDNPAQVLHATVLDSINNVMENMQELDDYDERNEFLNIIWPSIHGTAVLTAQGHFVFDESSIVEKADHIVNCSLAIWKQSRGL